MTIWCRKHRTEISRQKYLSFCSKINCNQIDKKTEKKWEVKGGKQRHGQKIH